MTVWCTPSFPSSTRFVAVAAAAVLLVVSYVSAVQAEWVYVALQTS